MEPQKGNDYFDLNAPELEIFSSELPKKPVKGRSNLSLLLDKTYVRAALTSTLLFVLFVSTFFIASRIQKPTFTTSSASVGYIPEANINLPQTPGVSNCSELTPSSELTFLQSYCQGDLCIYQEDLAACESVDVVVVKDGILKEDSGQDGVSDCLWVEEEASCKPKY